MDDHQAGALRRIALEIDRSAIPRGGVILTETAFYLKDNAPDVFDDACARLAMSSETFAAELAEARLRPLSNGILRDGLTDAELVFCARPERVQDVLLAGRVLGLSAPDQSGEIELWVLTDPHDYVRACQAAFAGR